MNLVPFLYAFLSSLFISSSPPKIWLEGDLKSWISNLVSSLPGNATEAYNRPTDEDLWVFREAAQLFVNEDWGAASMKAAEVNYDVVEIEDNQQKKTYALIPGTFNKDGRGYFLMRSTGDWNINVLIESPHSVHDTVGPLAGEVFDDTGARGFMMPGTHRCSSSSFTECTGTSKICSGYRIREKYRASDMAHVTDSFFQVFHEVMSLHSSSLVAIQIHGFRSDDTRSEFIASVGSKQNYNGSISNSLTEIMNVEIKAANSPKIGRSCNREEAGWKKRFCGTWNPQGRWSNGVRGVSSNSSACTTAATQNTNTFIQLEISKNITRTITAQHVTNTLKQLFKQ